MRHHDIDPPYGSMMRQVPDVRTLAQKALVSIAGQKPLKPGAPCPDLIDDLSSALLDPMDAVHGDAVARIAAAGVKASEIIDLYIPESARRIGDLWVSDQCSFVDVSVAASRLQRLLRMMARGFDTAIFPNRPPQRVLIVIPEGEQHTLGGFLAANQMMRAGIWAEITFGADRKTLKSRIQETSCALIGISVGSEKGLKHLDTLIETILDAREKPPGLLFGGWAIDTLPGAIDDLPVTPIGTSVSDALAYLSAQAATRADRVLTDAP